MRDETIGKHEHYTLYRAAFEGRINLSDLKQLPSTFAKAGSSHALFVCPCGGVGHAATAALDYDTGTSITMSPVVHCYETGKQWLMIKDVGQIIQREEEAYFSLLNKFANTGIIGKRVSAAEAFRLHTEQGAPHELLEIENIEEFSAMMETHRHKSSKHYRSNA